MDDEKVFRTKTGFCHILPDKIVLSRNGIVGYIATITCGNSISRIIISYCIVSIGLFNFAYNAFQAGQVVQTAVPVIAGVFLIYGILNSLNYSATPIIERKKIRKISFKKGIPGWTRSRFEVVFENTHGKMKKRLIMLPGSLTGGINEVEVAFKIMEEEGLLPKKN